MLREILEQFYNLINIKGCVMRSTGGLEGHDIPTSIC
jgi:hypothetical protein